MTSSINETLIRATVTRRENQTDDIALFVLSAVDGSALPPFQAGAHIDVILDDDTIRQYSLSNAPGEGVYRLGILNDPNSRGGSKRIHAELETGAELTISAPRNHFPLEMEAAHSLLIGGGIGITPMIAMAYALKAAGRSFELHYCSRSESKAAFLAELKREFGEQLVLHFDDAGDAARIDPKALCQDAVQGSHVYVCGPGGFMDWVIEQSKAAGLPDAQIHFEYFSAEVDISGEAFEVFAETSGVTVQVGPNESIATALKAAGVKVQMSCEEGVCGTCICDVLEGTPDHRDHFLTEEEKEDNDQIALCCSRAKSARLVIDI
ncbi:vanillate O-demethylase oxidoreductase [Marinobacterium zhoushanense]|uniref:Vanillate O-demethylase oxidoreductase n=1 Tax=Marinobacterium zhoushanense TaxID=1679163 RepID=A0ABQ1K5G9_9GAMM|nr:PDR/VanB family oxidoreductase [Marinobacterium zhoushanense]GGB84716.1 vanillate O-demethylase oxidoreductase [Marinobacterium zhoushanense]